MPTTYVAPGCDPLLQDIANTLWKSRKVVVITGAGISTNSGIPDFRSENGLYSLIQAQFDAAQQQATENNSDAGGQDAEQRPAKRQRKTLDDPELGRRRASRDHGLPFPGLRGATEKSNDTRTDQNTDNTESEEKQQPARHEDSLSERGAERAQAPDENNSLPQSVSSSPDSKANRLADAQHPNTENAPCPSSPPSFVLGTPHPRRAHLLETLPGSSSPLSSPPPIMYDPYQETTSCSSDRGTESSRSQSEEPSSATTPLLSSQTSITSRTSLPSMKGRDLFDAQIWSCPIKTSVFYTFVSTLREKVRNAEPTISHRFVSVLRDSRKLVRCYTQNIDQLEERVGLSTSLSLGAGSRYRFSTRAGRNSGAAKGQGRGADGAPEANQGASQKDEEQERSRTTQPDSANVQDEASPPASQQTAPAAPNRGVECVFLHGSLAELRCFVCARTASWEEDDRLEDTLAGRQPTCPHCAGATAAREEKGKRALGVGKLRPDIVLYGEEHPHAHLISPLVQHDLSLGPDMLLILGTSMRVHGLKVLVKEFAKAVHDRGGKVVFVNFTKPPDSVWADIIDYWVQWDCDAWVTDLRARKPALWLPPGAALPEEEKPKTARLSRRRSGAESSKRKDKAEKITRKKRESDDPTNNRKEESGEELKQDADAQAPINGHQEDKPPTPPKEVSKKAAKIPREPKLNPDAKRPASVRDHKLNGAYLVGKIMEDLRRITGDGSVNSVASSSDVVAANSKRKRPRKSAPAALNVQGVPADHGVIPEPYPTATTEAQAAIPASSPVSTALPSDTLSGNNGNSSISAAVKSRRRKQAVAWRIIGGVETRVTLNNTAEPQMPVASSLPRSQAVLRPSPVPHHRRLPPPTPTTPKPTPLYQPNNIQSHIPRPQPITAGPPASAIDMAINAGFRETDRLIAQVHHETLLSRPATPSSQLRLPPLLAANLPDQRHRPGQSNGNNDNSQQQHNVEHWQKGGRGAQQPQQAHHLPPHQQDQYPTTKLVPLEPKVDSPGPRQAISSNVGSPVACASAGRNPFFLSDPLAGWLGYPPVWLHHHPPHHLHHPHQKFRSDVRPQQQRRDYGGNYDGSDGCSGATDNLADTDSGTGSDAKREQQRETEASSPWCPNEQLRKEQEAALMLSAMRGTGEYR
ncbi:DHS-like NAD/FAD-binding domain-containing protein [Thermothelomyces heterothallicus CBS 203.75]